VQALGNAFGDLDGPPFIKLDKDDRSGAATDGENLLVSAEHSQYIKRLAVFAFIYEGVKKWSQAGAVVTIHSGDGPVTINLDETRDGVGMCAICIIESTPSGFAIERQVQYISGHRELDELFGWGLNWRAGRK
jgi:tellurite resistance protein TerA